MEEYQKRVVGEKHELDDKRTKLESFLECTASAQIEPNARGLLQKQLAVMDQYSDILKQRIELFGLSEDELTGIRTA